jgi:hypothetical protein
MGTGGEADHADSGVRTQWNKLSGKTSLRRTAEDRERFKLDMRSHKRGREVRKRE